MNIDEMLGLHPIEIINLWARRLLIGIAHIFEGLICLLTLGSWLPGLPLKAAENIARYRWLLRNRRDYD